MATSAQIRDMLHRRLVVPRRVGEPVAVIDELGLGGGVGVADVVRIVDTLWGWEIKGRGDTTKGLFSHDVKDRNYAGCVRHVHGQIATYGAYFERCSLIATPKLAERAFPDMPWWWEVIAVHEVSGRLVLRRLRDGRPNPAYPADAQRLLWGAELTRLLKRAGCPTALRNQNVYVRQHCFDQVVSEEAALAAVRWCFRQRSWDYWRRNQPLPLSEGSEDRELSILERGIARPTDWITILEMLPRWQENVGLRRRLWNDLPNSITLQPGVCERLLGAEAAIWLRPPTYGPPAPHPRLLATRRRSPTPAPAQLSLLEQASV